MTFAYFVHDGFYWEGPFWKPVKSSVAIEIGDRCRHSPFSKDQIGAAVQYLLNASIPLQLMSEAMESALDCALAYGYSIEQAAYQIRNVASRPSREPLL